MRGPSFVPSRTPRPRPLTPLLEPCPPRAPSAPATGTKDVLLQSAADIFIIGPFIFYPSYYLVQLSRTGRRAWHGGSHGLRGCVPTWLCVWYPQPSSLHRTARPSAVPPSRALQTKEVFMNKHTDDEDDTGAFAVSSPAPLAAPHSHLPQPDPSPAWLCDSCSRPPHLPSPPRVQAVFDTWKTNFVEDAIMSLKIWGPCNFANFALCPMHWRIPFMGQCPFSRPCSHRVACDRQPRDTCTLRPCPQASAPLATAWSSP